MRIPVQTFAGNPLDRAHDRRLDQDWLSARLQDETSSALAVWNGAILLDGERLARLPVDLACELSGQERLLFLGLDDEGSATFAIDLEGVADPTAGPLDGLGQFTLFRRLNLSSRATGNRSGAVRVL